MRHTSALATAALALVALASTARAQAAGSTANATSAPSAAAAAASAPATPWSAKAAGTYDITVSGTDGDGTHSESATLVIGTDSSGALTAKVVEGPHDDEHPMTVEVNGDDLVMKSQTNNGVMTITIRRRGDALDGHWEIGMQQGTLTGKLHS
ncbi:MAG: hypothetical protein HOQ12_13370 [Gemmatimonadaceae bacterium]|nr:hypothetical protein [Gemmatimonadaceae bacterium]NUQ92416.1 hypothetical protein [Gemmatimonadaceae bacterium]NUR20518.1 hypothetical protein [Gemmatimonadaceae bacterium]